MNLQSIINHKLSVLNSEKGQILVGFLLVSVLGLTLTLSLISRSTTDIRTTTTVEQSSRAYNAAEAGVEEALKKLEGGSLPTGASPLTGTSTFSTGATFDYSLSLSSPGTKAFVFPDSLRADDVVQIWLADYQTLAASYTSGRIKVLWGNEGTLTTDSQAPGLEITLVYKNNTTGAILDQKWYYKPSSAPIGFNPSTDIATGPHTILANQNQLSIDQKFAFKINEGGLEGLNIGKVNFTANTPLLLRFRMLYNSDSAHILALWPLDTSTASTLPTQGYLVESTGTLTTPGVARKIKVFRPYPVTSNIFDFALFSGSKDKPLKK